MDIFINEFTKVMIKMSGETRDNQFALEFVEANDYLESGRS